MNSTTSQRRVDSWARAITSGFAWRQRIQVQLELTTLKITATAALTAPTDTWRLAYYTPTTRK